LKTMFHVFILIYMFLSRLFFLKSKSIIVGFGNSVGRVLEASRISVAWISVGICSGAVEKTIDYVSTRVAFGAPLSSNQLIQGKRN
jgi:hypothetical protein